MGAKMLQSQLDLDCYRVLCLPEIADSKRRCKLKVSFLIKLADLYLKPETLKAKYQTQK
jgi:hypothetical protein